MLKRTSVIHGIMYSAHDINTSTNEFDNISGLYSGDQCAFPDIFPSSTSVISSCCGIRAANTVINKLTTSSKYSY